MAQKMMPEVETSQQLPVLQAVESKWMLAEDLMSPQRNALVSQDLEVLLQKEGTKSAVLSR